MPVTRVETGVSKTAGLYSRDLDPAKANERIYGEVKDGHKDENHQSVQHLRNRQGDKNAPLSDSIKAQ